MSGQVFRITELNPRLEMEIARLLETEDLNGRFSSGCDLFGVFDSDGSLAGIAGSREFEKQCLLHFVVVRECERGEGVGTALISRILIYSSERCSDAWIFATACSSMYFERFGFEHVTTDRIPGKVRDSRDLAGIEIASMKVMTLRMPDSWQSI